MKPRKSLTACLLLLAITFTAYAATDAPGVEINQVAVNKVRLNSSELQIHKLLGMPERVIDRGESEAIGGKSKDIYYSGLKIHLINGKIFGLECQGVICLTDKGIRIGDTRAKVEQAYGMASQDDTDRIGYTFRVNGRFIDSSFVFFFKNGKVIRIVYHVDFT